MKTLSRILGVGASLALLAPFALHAQQEPIIAVDITDIAVVTGSGSVISTNLTAGGTNYTTAPTVTLSGGGGVGASAVARINGGVVTGLQIVDAGTGYTSMPTVVIAPPGATATVTATVDTTTGRVTAINASGGSNYRTAPTIQITGGGTSAAKISTTLQADGTLAFELIDGGAGYTVPPTITVPPPGTTATAVVDFLGTWFPDPEQNESWGPANTFFTIRAEARGLLPTSPWTYRFFVNGVELGSSVNPQPPGGGPGLISWAPPQPGAYTLVVEASGAGHTARSLPVRYFATGTAMIGPTDNTLVPNGSSVVVQATATPPPSVQGATAFVSRMEFYVDGQLASTDTTYPYSFIYTPAPSPTTHTIEARGFDNNGAQISPNFTPMATRQVHMVTPIGTTPIVRIANPPDASSVQAGSAANIVVDAVAPDGFIRRVDFYVNGVQFGTTNKFPFEASWTPPVPGKYQFTAIAYDDKSNAVASSPINLTATGSFPTVSVAEPDRSGFTVVQGSSLPVLIRASGADGGISSLKTVELLINGSVYDVLPKAPTSGSGATGTAILAEPFEFTWKANVAVGTHRIAARATGTNGLSITSSEITVNVVANQLPKVTITSPADGASTTVGVDTTIVSAPTDADGTVEAVEFFVNGASIGSASKAPFQITWKPTVNGEAVLTAKATDNGGKSAMSDPVRINVDPIAPSGPAQTTIAATVFRGSYGSLGENGQFAFAVNRNNRGTFVAYSTTPAGRTSFWTDVAVSADGSFEVRDAANALQLSGQMSASGVSGTFGGKTFIGPVTSSTASFTPLLVTGSLTGVAGSQAVAIVGGDSSVTLYVANGLLRDAGSGMLSATGSYSFAAPTGGRFSGTVANAAAIVSGTVAGSQAGSFVLRQQASRITNISTRALAGSGDRTLVAGFVVSGTGNKPLLVRAIGPTLANFGVANSLADPTLNVLSRTQTLVASNNDWGNSAALSSLFSLVGAFALSPGSRDSALQTSLAAGTYTAVIGGGTTAGAALVEIYDYDTSNPATSRITNISTRGQVGAGDSLIAGFAISGDVRKKVLIRAVGPTLASFGITGVLADPKIDVLAGSTVIASNNDWTETATVAQVTSVSPSVGAFPLNANSRDAAVVLQLAPGAYTVQISGGAGSTGTVLVEIYDADL